LPAVIRPVSSFIAELSGAPPEVVAIECIDPAENAADKLSALVWRISGRQRGMEDDDPSIVRHLHDLSILKDAALGHIEFRRLALTTINNDDLRCRQITGLSATEKFAHVQDIIETDTEYLKEYERFVKGMSYAADNDMPSFQQAWSNVKLLFQHVAGD